jgi:hypothetical protein
MMNNKAAKKKRTARVLSHDGRHSFWTTQTQFWAWARTGTIIKLGDAPLTGRFCSADEEQLVVRSGIVLNLSAPNHLREYRLACARAR